MVAKAKRRTFTAEYKLGILQQAEGAAATRVRDPGFVQPLRDRVVGCLQDSRAFSQGFFRWYNQELRHSELGLLTPAMVHYNQTALILEQRQAVLDAAYRIHPERFVRQAPKPAAVQPKSGSTNR